MFSQCLVVLCKRNIIVIFSYILTFYILGFTLTYYSYIYVYETLGGDLIKFHKKSKSKLYVIPRPYC